MFSWFYFSVSQVIQSEKQMESDSDFVASIKILIITHYRSITFICYPSDGEKNG